jgi:hypothetical protein
MTQLVNSFFYMNKKRNEKKKENLVDEIIIYF